jgi:excisionase family DNA binding protein
VATALTSEAQEPPPLSLKDAAECLGVHYMTAYRYVRTGRLEATRSSSGWLVTASAIEQLRNEPDDSAAPGRKRPSGRLSFASRSRRLRVRLVAGDEHGAWAIVEEALVSGAEPGEIYLELLVPALRDIGIAWSEGVLDVGDEHRASYVAERLIGRMGPRFARRGKTRGTVVIAAPAGERHALPIALVGDLLRSKGFALSALGADTPAESIAHAVTRTLAERPSATILLLCVTSPGNDESVEQTIEAARWAAPSVPIGVGGAAVPSEAAALALGADAWTGADGHSVVETAIELTERGR